MKHKGKVIKTIKGKHTGLSRPKEILNNYWMSSFVMSGMIKVDDSADNTYQDLDYSRYYKNSSSDSSVLNSSWLLLKH